MCSARKALGRFCTNADRTVLYYIDRPSTQYTVASTHLGPPRIRHSTRRSAFSIQSIAIDCHQVDNNYAQDHHREGRRSIRGGMQSVAPKHTRRLFVRVFFILSMSSCLRGTFRQLRGCQQPCPCTYDMSISSRIFYLGCQ